MSKPTESDEDCYLERCQETLELARAGRLAEAEVVIRSVPDENGAPWLYEKALALVEIARETAPTDKVDVTLGLLREGLRLVDGFGDGVPWERPDCLERIAVLFDGHGEHLEALKAWDQAAELAAHCQCDDPDCLKILAQVARDLALAGQWERSKAVAESVGFEECREATVAFIESTRAGKRPPNRLYDPVPRFLDALKDADASVREQAAYGIGELQLDDIEVVRALREAVNDSEERVRRAAETSLKRLRMEH